MRSNYFYERVDRISCNMSIMSALAMYPSTRSPSEAGVGPVFGGGDDRVGATPATWWGCIRNTQDRGSDPHTLLPAAGVGEVLGQADRLACIHLQGVRQ